MLEQSLDLFSFLTVEAATPLSHEDYRIVKGLLLFVYIHNKKNIFFFFVK